MLKINNEINDSSNVKPFTFIPKILMFYTRTFIYSTLASAGIFKYENKLLLRYRSQKQFVKIIISPKIIYQNS